MRHGRSEAQNASREDSKFMNKNTEETHAKHASR